MATQTIEFVAPSGLTLTADVAVSATDTLSQTALSATERTNKKGFYTVSFTGTLSGLYDIVIKSGATVVGVDSVKLLNATATYQVQSLLSCLDETVSSRLATTGYTAPDNTSITGIKAKTDSLTFTTAGRVDATAITVSDKTGYSLSQSFPANFASMNLDVSGKVLLQPTQTGVTIPTVTAVTNAVTVGTINAGVITAGSIAANAITSAKIATDAIGAAQLAADATTEIQSGLATSSALATAQASLTKFETMIALSGSVYQYTTNALANSPGGGGAGDATLANQETIIGLLDSAIIVNNPPLVSGELSIYAGADFSKTIDVTIPTNWAKVYFTVKKTVADADAKSLLQMIVSNPSSGSDGAIVINGANTSSLIGDGSLTVDATADTVQIFIPAAITTLLNETASARAFDWNIQVIDNAGNVPLEMDNGKGKIYRLATRTVS